VLNPTIIPVTLIYNQDSENACQKTFEIRKGTGLGLLSAYPNQSPLPTGPQVISSSIEASALTLQAEPGTLGKPVERPVVYGITPFLFESVAALESGFSL
jgi:hypothetical protein